MLPIAYQYVVPTGQFLNRPCTFYQYVVPMERGSIDIMYPDCHQLCPVRDIILVEINREQTGIHGKSL